jgi:hypothetical protein
MLLSGSACAPAIDDRGADDLHDPASDDLHDPASRSLAKI